VQIRIINTCCILHNFVLDRQQDMDRLLINQVDNQIPNEIAEGFSDQLLVILNGKYYLVDA
jgi:hypothetical protein